jgi:hypothetical protein
VNEPVVCREHIPDYAKDGRALQPADGECVVCHCPALILLPPILIEGAVLLRSDGEWPK